MEFFLIISLTVIALLQVGYYGFFFFKFAYSKSTHFPEFNRPVSVIISCHNEYDHIKVNWEKWFYQDYKTFEIILIDDASTDKTWEIIQNLASQFENIKTIQIPKNVQYKGNKKNALTLGIQKAKYKYLLFTDADCIPASHQWIKEMSKGFKDGKNIVLGYGKYKANNGFLNKVIRYETLLTAWQYLSYAIRGQAYMGVGRNLAYTKYLFQQNNGFQNHAMLRSGDDDLFVSQNATKTNVSVICSPESYTISTPKNTWKEWIQQKRRHITTATTYSSLHQFLLGLFYLSQFLFYFLSIYLILLNKYTAFVIFIVILRFLAYYFTLVPVAKKLKEKDLILFAPVLELFLIVFQGIIFVMNTVSKPKQW